MTNQNTDRSSTGVPGLDEILCGGYIPARIYLVEGHPGRRQDHDGAAVPAGGLAPRRTLPVRDAVGNTRRTGSGRRVARLVAGWHRGHRADCRRAPVARRRPDHDVPPGRGGADRNDAQGGRDAGTREASAHGVRLAVGAAPAGAELAALPAPDHGAEAAPARIELHRAAARRPHRRRAGPATAEHRARRAVAAAQRADLRARAAPAARW